MLRDDTPHKTWPFHTGQKFPGNHSLCKSYQSEFPQLILPIILLSAPPNQHNATGTLSAWATQDTKLGQPRVSSYTTVKPGATRKKVRTQQKQLHFSKSKGRPEEQKEQKVVVDGEQPDRMAWLSSLYFFSCLLRFCRTPQETGHYEKEGTPQKHLPVQPIVLGRRKLHRTAFMKENG